MQAVNSASKAQSIWRDVDRNTFRQHAVALRKYAAEIAGDEVVHSANDWQVRNNADGSATLLLPFDVEQRIADDLAFIAAAEDNLRVVSAVALEQYIEPRNLAIRLAANEVVPGGVPGTFEAIFELLSRCARKKLPRKSCAETIFDHVMVLSQRRVWKRLQRAPLAIPIGLAGKTYRPLRTEILMLCSALQGNKSSTSRGSQLLIQQLERLIEKMKSVEGCPPRSNAELALLRDIVINSDSICTGNGSPSLEKYVFDNELVALDFRSLPCIRQIDKIGRYWGMCKSMAEDSRKYPDLFASIKLNPPLSPYKAPKSLITAGRARSTHLHVHAEMQILAFYGLSSSAEIPKPRVIGVSRAACYLCNLFVQSHGQFFVTKTHGWLFDAWNFPDLAGSDPHQQTRYRHAIARMDVEIQRASAQERWNPSMRQKPMGSRLALPLQSRLSPAPSTDLSTVLEVDEVAMHLPASYPAARRLEETKAETRLPGSRSDLSVTPMSAVSSYTPIPTPGIGKPLGAPSEIPPPSPPTTQPASFRHSSHSSLSRVEPINRTDLPPACTSIPLSLNPPSPSSEPTQPPAASGGKEISTLSSSSSSIMSWELPVTRPVASKSPFRIRSNNVTISFEIEDGARGSVSIEELSTTSDGLITGPPSIDLKAVSEDQILTFGRRDDESSVVLSLKSSNDDAKKITLRWIG